VKTITEMEKYREAILRRGVLPETPLHSDYAPPPGSREVPSSKSWLAFRGPVRDQGAEGSCAGYGMLKVYEMEHLRLTGEQLDTSERFCYNLAKIVDVVPADFMQQEGTTLRATARVLRHYGVCDESDWRYLPGDRAHVEIARFLKILQKARKRRIAEYRNLLKSGVNKSTLTIIKRALCRRPIVCGLLVRNNWLEVGRDGFIVPEKSGRCLASWRLGERNRRGETSRKAVKAQRAVSSTELMAFWRASLRAEGGEWVGGHAVALALYNDRLEVHGRRGWFGFVNSWSEGWGDRGIGYIDYDSFIRALMSCYEIVLAREGESENT